MKDAYKEKIKKETTTKENVKQMKDKEKKPLLTISRANGYDIAVDVNEENCKELVDEAKLAGELKNEEDTAISIMGTAMTQQLIKRAKRTGKSLADELTEHIAATARSFAAETTPSKTAKKDDQEHDEINEIVKTLEDALLVVYAIDDSNLGVRVNPNIAFNTGTPEDTSNSMADGILSTMNALVSVLALIASMAVEHGADEMDTLMRLMESLTTAIEDAFPDVHIEKGIQNIPPFGDHNEKNGPLPS